jgi:hypothetical protein
MNLAFVALLVATASDPRVKDAERLAAHGELDAARAQYQAIHDELAASGAEASSGLHYNLGTLALSADDIGAAVLHLLAAARRAPLDDDVQHNLATALAHRADQVEASSPDAMGARLPPGPVALAFGSLMALLGVLLAIRGAASGRATMLAGRALVPTLVTTLVAGGLFGLRRFADSADVAVVMSESEARPQPDASAAGFAVHPGLTGRVMAEQRGFLRLRLENGVDVWVDRKHTQLVP